ncbi:MAG: tRNA uridine-5-carboxymethylaminomethyl(34) synthesis GTPase MnmE [Paracoccus denitrificans]|nr:MAG: tRNA uridine-5-carboxymethylaminomethyl(34) synthesis GTPase MnmE [Paracoccus denitrificans]PZO85617.1 MAG: tRNA uridine-5-carboxymethylaminomethyl(34) synthesis GTPase MnmE [Paracoccus denitrificans]
MDTIFAEATPPGRGGISVVRLSGPDARRIGEDLAGPLPTPRRAELRKVVDDGDLIDQALVLRFDEGASFTGEQVVEFHLHGAPVISRRVMAACERRGARLAEAGEFTQRGFLNGQIDLAQAEGLADLLAAETESQRKLAMQVAGGDLSAWADEVRRKLIRAGALIEASLDFADEEMPEEVPSEVFSILDDVRDMMNAQLAGFPAAERVRQGFEVALIGPPNAGKSSLLNAIAQRDVALVTDIPGTTRDVLEVSLDLRGLAVTLLDTAGLRETRDTVEGLGIERARERAAAADIRLHLSEDGFIDPTLWQEGDIAVRSKADIGDGDVSSASGVGITELLERIYLTLSERVAGAGFVARERQAAGLRSACASLDQVNTAPPEVLAELVRAASSSLQQMVGRIGVEDYLDEVFSSFCVGK